MDTSEGSEISRTIEILNATNNMTLDNTSISSNPDSTHDDNLLIDVHHNSGRMNAHFCEFTDPSRGQCRQRAINGFVYCIRHILLDPNAPYKQCQHKRKPKNKHDPPSLCTNAIRSTSSEIYCTTHLMMTGSRVPKRKDSKSKNNLKISSTIEDSVESLVTLNCRNSQSLQPSSSNLLDNQNQTSVKDDETSHESIPWNPQCRQYMLEFMDKRKSDVFYPLADRLLKSPTRQQNMDTSSTYINLTSFQENDNFVYKQEQSFCAKTYPQLSAKLHNTEKLISREENVADGLTSNVIQRKDILTDDKLIKSTERKNLANEFEPSHYSPEHLVHHDIRTRQNLIEYDFPVPTFGLSSSLYLINSEKLPRHYDMDRLEQKLAAETEDENELVKFQRDYANDFDSNTSTLKRKQKVIKLRQKRQKVRIDGVFRKTRTVDTMCRVVESYDFDSTDLFPLGLEPSDDESSSDDSFPSFDDDLPIPSVLLKNMLNERNTKNRIELYLLKKKLRLESARLVQKSKFCIPINIAAKQYVNYTGAALRIRRENKGRGNFGGKIRENRFQRCAQVLQHQIVRDGKRHLFNARCLNFCLPWARHCTEHITYSVTQQLFTYCKWRLCNATVSTADALLFEGFCRRHYLEKQKMAQNLSNINPPTQTDITKPMKRELSGSTSISKNTHENPIIGGFDYPSANTVRDDHLNVVDGDVSLASVAKDLGFDGRELTDMLERLPVEEAFEGEMEADDENFLNGMNKDDSDEVPPGISLGHSWADVEQFLLEQEQHQSISDESTPQF